MLMRAATVAAIFVAILAFHVSEALAATTPGWECIPTTAGQAVVSGGTGAAPSCGAEATAVLAPTYVPSGVGGLPTVEFSGVNVQIVSGSGSTAGAVNGKGNLVIGYAENAHLFARTGSNNFVVGSNGNTASGLEATVSGGEVGNASGGASSVAGGQFNTASGGGAAVAGGDENSAGAPAASVLGGDGNS